MFKEYCKNIMINQLNIFFFFLIDFLSFLFFFCSWDGGLVRHLVVDIRSSSIPSSMLFIEERSRLASARKLVSGKF